MSHVWVCPRCHEPLAAGPATLVCQPCGERYPLLGDIPDLRIERPTWIDFRQDREKAEWLLARAGTLTAAQMTEAIFTGRGWKRADVERRIADLTALGARMPKELDDWLADVTSREGPFLDVGCGAGTLLASAAKMGRPGLGCDVSLQWLVVARQRILEQGGQPVLAAATAEALPLRKESVGGVMLLDVIEHVADQRLTLAEVNRVLRPGGVCALATPNRFSLTLEPHVSLWGVGWLPRRWQAAYVYRRRGRPYQFCRLLSVFELERLVRSCTALRPHTLLPTVPVEDMVRFSGPKRLMARAYNWTTARRALRPVLLGVCPFFRVIATKVEQVPGTRSPATG